MLSLFTKHKGEKNKMKELLTLLIQKLVDKPGEVSVDEKSDKDTIRLKVKVNPDDLGKVIGKKGQTIGALRTYVTAIGAKEHKKRVNIDLDEF